MKEPIPTVCGEPMSRVVGGILGLTGFSTALLVGVLVGNPPLTTLTRGLICMVACAVVGRLLGSAGAIATGEFVRRYQQLHPLPHPPAELQGLQARRNRHKQIVDEMKRPA